jgi:hypothetical protein
MELISYCQPYSSYNVKHMIKMVCRENCGENCASDLPCTKFGSALVASVLSGVFTA